MHATLDSKVCKPFLSRCSTSAPRESSRATSLACPPAAANVNAVSWLLSVCASTSIGSEVFPDTAGLATAADDDVCLAASMQQLGHGVARALGVCVPADGRERPEHAARSAAFFCAASVAAFPTQQCHHFHLNYVQPSNNNDNTTTAPTTTTTTNTTTNNNNNNINKDRRRVTRQKRSSSHY